MVLFDIFPLTDSHTDADLEVAKCDTERRELFRQFSSKLREWAMHFESMELLRGEVGKVCFSMQASKHTYGGRAKMVKCANAKSNAQMPNVQTLQCANAQILKCTNAQMLKCSNAQILKCTNSQTPTHKCSTNAVQLQFQIPTVNAKEKNKKKHNQQTRNKVVVT